MWQTVLVYTDVHERVRCTPVQSALRVDVLDGCLDFVAFSNDVQVIHDDIPAEDVACITGNDVELSCFDVEIACVHCIHVNSSVLLWASSVLI